MVFQKQFLGFKQGQLSLDYSQLLPSAVLVLGFCTNGLCLHRDCGSKKKELCGKLVHTVSETPNAPSLGETRECGVRSPIAPKGDMIVIMLVQGA